MLSIVISFFSLFFSIISFTMSIHNGNKQALFDKRLTIFMHAEEFKQVIDDNKSCLKIPSGVSVDNTIQFRNMINSPFLNELYALIPDPFNRDGPGPQDNAEAQKRFLLTKAKILKDSETASLIFASPENTIVSDFIRCFVALLDSRRLYAIYEKDIRKKEKEYRSRHPGEQIDTEEFLNQHTDQRDYQSKYLEDPIHQLTAAYSAYCHNRSKIKQQIRLTRSNLLYLEFWRNLLKRK